LIDKSAERISGPDGADLRVVSTSRTQAISGQTGASCRDVEIAALENGVVPSRYLRNQSTYDCSDQIRFLRSRVAIVGLGGLGGAVAEILARAGVGALTLVDGDRFEEHNLNRQLFCTQDNLGSTKASAAETRVAAINSAVETRVVPTFLSAENAFQVIAGHDVVVDCLDNIPSRFVAEDAARQAGIPLVSAAIGGLTGQVTVIYPQDGGLEWIYGPRDSARQAQGAEHLLGCPPQTVVLVAAMQCGEVLSILCHRTSQLLRNKLWIVDLSDHTVEVLALAG